MPQPCYVRAHDVSLCPDSAPKLHSDSAHVRCQRTNARTPTTSTVPPSLTCATMCALSAGVLIPTHTGKISSRHSPLPSPSHTPPLLFAVAQAPMSRQRCSASSITRPSSLCTASPPCWSPSPNKPSAARGLKQPHRPLQRRK
jgi:hypothetical protein